MRTRLAVLLARLAGTFTGGRSDARLAEEIDAHLDALAAAHEARGLSSHEARLAARREFGGVDQMTDRHRDQRGFPWVDAFVHDVRLAVRRLHAEPWFSAAVIVALAIGVGGSVSVVGAVTAISGAQPPFRDPDGVLSVGTVDDRGRRADVSWAEFQEWRDGSVTFERLAGFSGSFFTIGVDGGAVERIQGAYVAASTFRLLGVVPVQGRDFTEADDVPGAPSVALIAEGVALSLFGSSGDSVGRSVLVDGLPTTIVGVMAADVSFPLNGALWRPLTHMAGLREDTRERRTIGVIGRLQPGTPRDAALAELTTIAARQPSDADVRRRPVLRTFRERFLGTSTDPVPLALLVVSGMVLLIGCATAATLLFARSAFRMDEAAMRVALGASRRRLVLQLLVECGVCAAVAGGIGLALARFALHRFAIEVDGAGLPAWVQFTVNARVVAIAAAATLMSTLLGGLAPAWRLAGTAATRVPGRMRMTDGRPTQRWIRALLVAKVALTLVLLSTSGYLLSGALALYRADQIVDSTGLVTASLGVTGPTLVRAEDRAAFTRRFVERLQGRGDLQAATITTGPPFAAVPARPVAIDDTGGDDRDSHTARVASIDAAYFETLGVALLEGRGFAATDDAAPQIVVVNAAFATRYLGGQAIGRRLQVAPSATEAPGGPWLTVVGVSPSLRNSSRPDPEPAIYIPMAIEHPATVVVMVRASEGVPVADILRQELQALDPSLALYGWQTVERLSEISRWTMRTVGGIVVMLGSLALALAALGIYAVTAYAAGRRVKEVGIRLAVGATVPSVTRLFLAATLRPVALGLGLGLVAGWAASRALLALVLEDSAVGTPMLLPAAAVIAAVSTAAAVLPARRVAALDPLIALRCD